MKINLTQFSNDIIKLNKATGELITLANEPCTAYSFKRIHSLKFYIVDLETKLDAELKKIRFFAKCYQDNLEVVKANISRAFEIADTYIENFDYSNIKGD